MADGYARVTGRPGVCFIITGPGMTNIATAMAQAYADSIPMLVISSVNARRELGRGDGRLHELPSQRDVFAGLTAFSHTLLDAADLPQVLARAFAVFASARRPVHIEIPLDVIVMPAPALSDAPPALPARPAPDANALAAAAGLLAHARRPLILAGGGAIHAAAELRELAERLHAPVALTINAKGLLPAGHPLLIGSTQSLPATRAAIRDADVVLAVGTELGETDYDVTFDGGFAIDGRLIRIDIDAQQLMRNARAEIAIAGDAQLALGALSTRLHETPAPTPDADWGARVAAVRAAIASMHDGAARSQARLIDTIVATLPGAIIAGDSTAPSTSATSPTTHRRRAAGSTRRPATARSATGCPPRSAPARRARAPGRVSDRRRRPAVHAAGPRARSSAAAGDRDRLEQPRLRRDPQIHGGARHHAGRRRSVSPDFQVLARGFGCARARPRHPARWPPHCATPRRARSRP